MENDDLNLPSGGRSLTLADGTIYENSTCGYSEGWLWCYLPADTDIHEAFSVFSDKEKTHEIQFRSGNDTTLYKNFTDFFGISKDMDGAIRVQLHIMK